jgi:hypothetical protein
MKKQLFLLAALFVIVMMLPATALAQSYEDVVHLKNGSVIRGIIVEQVPNESLKIETRDGNLFVYQMGEVEKMTKEMTAFRSPRTSRFTGKRITRVSEFNKPQGYFGIVEVGGGLGLGVYPGQYAFFSMINGYRFFPQLAIGIGVSAEMFFCSWQDYSRYGDIFTAADSELSMPIFLHLRSDFIDGKVTPYIVVNAGYNISLIGGFTSGMMLDPSFGVSFNVGQKNRMMIGVGYAMSWIKDYYYHSSSSYDEYIRWGMAGGIKLKVGLSF